MRQYGHPLQALHQPQWGCQATGSATVAAFCRKNAQCSHSSTVGSCNHSKLLVRSSTLPEPQAGCKCTVATAELPGMCIAIITGNWYRGMSRSGLGTTNLSVRHNQPGSVNRRAVLHTESCPLLCAGPCHVPALLRWKASCIVSQVIVTDTIMPWLVPLRFTILAALAPKVLMG